MAASSKQVEQLTPFGHALAGALGGVFANAAVYPLDTIKTQIQADASHTHDAKLTHKGARLDQKSIIALLFSILREEGISGFYKGFGASMIKYAYFFFYTFVRNSYSKRLSRSVKAGAKVPAISTAMELILGAVAAALAQLFTIPVSVIATRQQVSRSKKRTATYPPQPYPQAVQSAEDEDSDSFMAVGRRIVREDGVGGLWLGIKPGLVLTVNPAITYGVFERVKGIVLSGSAKTKLPPWYSFAMGAFSKTLATVVTYPYIMAKVRVQASVKEDDGLDNAEKGQDHVVHRKRKYSGALDVLKKVWLADGFFGWYQGMNAQILKAVLTQALLFMSKDQFEHYALIILTLWKRALQA
ncbi:mitochondrial carrier domain-containing protein [Hysterangium stoloniferum]|nr:mitochondrial carrier domain-containing protein [Hysterangium stoloniferum]